ncbi:MAG: hypothetical protein IJO63_05115 [Bacilli bacterium]|nr:hypothetical protein [Bacilli bacterium]
MEEKKSKKLTFVVALICVVLCIPIGILIGKIIYDKPENTNNTGINNTVENPSGDAAENELKDANLISKLEEFTNLLGGSYISGQTFNLYENLKLTDDEKTYFVLASLKDNWVDLTEEEKNNDENMCRNGYVTYETASSMYNKMFEGTISKNINMFPYVFENNRFYTGGCGGFTATDIIALYNYKYTLEDNIYYVYQYVGLLDFEDNQLYADVEKTKKLDGKTAENAESITSGVYELFTKYRLSFKLVNDNFIFQGIEKI